jgi:hypothetical protein
MIELQLCAAAGSGAASSAKTTAQKTADRTQTNEVQRIAIPSGKVSG